MASFQVLVKILLTAKKRISSPKKEFYWLKDKKHGVLNSAVPEAN